MNMRIETMKTTKTPPHEESRALKKPYAVLDFPIMGDEKGLLVAIENSVQIPFDIKRVFYIYNTQPNVVRGCHANRKSQFVLMPVRGSCKVTIKTLHDAVDIELRKPNTGLWVDRLVWKEMHSFSDDAVLLILSSELYDKNEYIADYRSYLEELQKC